MKRVLLSSILIMLSFQTLIFAQRDSLRTLFLDAESWFLFEEYAEALPLYMELHASDQGNDNFNYKIGICLLNDPYQKDKAIQYLLDASENINPSYKENSVKERTAPPDALYHLGNAYLVNELLNHAIESYEEFLQVMDHDVYDAELVQAQIRSCRNAQRLKTMPADIDLTLIDEIINTRYSDIRPVISGDGTKMAFVTELPFYDGTFYTELTEEGWSYPQIITQTLGFDEDIYPVSLSYDGTEMILYYDDDYIGNLYYSKYEDGLWLPAVKLGENISTKYWESHASFSKDGQALYFTSNRKGTLGGLDIYVSERQSNGTWGVPVNLGPTINSPYNEESPSISQDGQTLYFSSYGHYNMGGYDIFYTKKDIDGSWGIPVNIGYPINTTDNDLYFQPIKNGDAAYYSIYSPRGIGQHDIYFMNIYSVNNPRVYSVTGKLHTEDGSLDSTKMAIYVIDADSGDTLVFTKPGQDGSFGFALKQGIYELHFKGEGYEALIKPLSITSESNKEGIQLADDIELDLVVKPTVIFEGEDSQIQLKETLYEGVAGETISVDVRAPKGSILVVRTYQDSMLVGTETIELEKRRTDLEIVPLPGTSVVEIEMIDEDGNIHRNSFTVIGAVPETKDAEESLGEDEQTMTPQDPVHDNPAGLLLLQLKDNSDGNLQQHLAGIVPEKENIGSERELMEYIYDQADVQDYNREDVDILLAGTVSDGDAKLLQEKLIDHSDGALKEYLQQLDLEAEGIHTAEDLMKHLEKVADQEGFTMGEIRSALFISLDGGKPGEDVEELVSQLSIEAEGALRAELEKLDLEKEGITSKKELFEHLYVKADSIGYSKNEVDAMLSDVLTHGDAELLRQQLIENSDGALKEYLQQLDLEKEGITNAGELLRHLEEVAEEEGFGMEDVRRAMLDSLDHPLEVDRIVGDLLSTTDGDLLEILEQLDLRKEGIYTLEELIEALSRKLAEKGYGSQEIEQILSGLFPDHTALIQELGEKYGQDTAGKNKIGWPLVLLFVAFGAGLIWFIIAWWRRREKSKDQDE
jgi:tetratricopeptide (TPR) repeat protein